MSKTAVADKLGDLLIQVTQAQVADALAKQRAGDARPFGMLLVELGYATPSEVELALMRQRARRGHAINLGLRPGLGRSGTGRDQPVAVRLWRSSWDEMVVVAISFQPILLCLVD